MLKPELLKELRSPIYGTLFILYGSSVLVLQGNTLAQARRQPEINPVPAELQQLLEQRSPMPQVSANSPSQKRFTIPSLWWTNQQFGDKLVLDWQAYGATQAGKQQIHVIVRPELWTGYSYYERYGFVLKFGTDASQFGYHLLVMDAQDLLLGAYTCDFPEANSKQPSLPTPQQVNSVPTTRHCRLWLSPYYPRGVF
ncbi:MAG: hypothetical protein HC940_01860 [Acaryochloris sp. SU_5_25]|nr:hypothetical protein [Acaryochloris sp. SU_5_25]